MAGRFSEDEVLFVREVLDQHGEHLVDLLLDQIEEKNLKKTDDLRTSLEYRVSMLGNNPVLHLSFKGYGRAIEINYHKRSSRKWNNLNEEANTAIWQQRSQRRKKKKDTRWYSKEVYGSLNRLISILMHEYTDQEKRRIKNILQHQKQRTS